MKTRSFVLLQSVMIISLTFPAHCGEYSFGNPMKGSWFKTEVPGQGFIIDYDDNQKFLFGGWFTFGLNSSNPLWLSLSGNLEDFADQHQLLIRKTSGGEFNLPTDVMSEVIGEAFLSVIDCNHMSLTVSMSLEETSINTEIPLRRTAFVDESQCDDLYTPQEVPDFIEKSQSVLIANVRYLDMQTGEYYRGSLLVENGIISEIFSSDSPKDLEGIITIDARGRYLIPGLADMHTHLATNVRELLGLGAPLQVTETSAVNQLILYLANGVTTILNNGDFGESLPLWALKVDNGDYMGPKIYSAKYARGGSNSCDGGPSNVTVTNAQQALSFVQTAKNEGYDFMKTYNCTPQSALQAILDVSDSLEMPVIGHLPQTMDAETVLQSGMKMVAHAEAYVWTFFNNLHNPNRIPEAVSISQEHQVTVTATLSILKLIAQVWGNNQLGIEQYWEREETIYMHPTTRRLNERSITSSRFNPPGSSPGGYNPRRDFVFQFTKALFDGEVRLLMGTDSPTVLGVPGFSAYDEMLALQDIGLTPFQVLQVSSKNAGEFISENLNEQVAFGKIEPGARADFILLSSNPLLNLDFRESLLAVMAQGRWYSKSLLDEKIQSVADDYQ